MIKSTVVLFWEAPKEAGISFFLTVVDCGLYFFTLFFIMQNKMEKPKRKAYLEEVSYIREIYLQNCLCEFIAAGKPILAAICKSWQAAVVLFRKILAIPML